MKLFDLLKKETSKVETENGDIAYATTSNYCVDLFGVIGAARFNLDGILDLFDNAYQENPKLALKILMYSRDIRNGIGERDVFRTIFSSLCFNNAKVAKQLLPYVVEVGRYDDILVGLHTPIEEDVISLIKTTLEKDLENLKKGENISLLAKWMPSINTSNKEVVKTAKYLASKLNMNAQEYRKMLSSLRKGRIIENNLRERDYTFNYESVPSLAMHKYRDAFNRNDGERYEEYLKAVASGEKKINTGAIYLYDIIREAYESWGNVVELGDAEKLAMQVKWDNIPRKTNLGNTIVVRDGSGSMCCNNFLPMLIANSLSIYFSELLTGNFKNKFITFSSRPQLVELKSKDLYGKIKELSRYNDVSNTNIAKVYDLLLNAYKSGIDKEDIIKRIIIISDMEFDVGVEKMSTFESFKKEFDKLGVEMPEIIYWNANARNIHFAANDEQKNIRYISGASSKILDAILENGELDSLNFVIEAVSRYSYIDEFDL